MDEELKKRALRILERRDVSRKMMLDRLTEKGASEEAAGEVTDWLCDIGAINDERYAGLVVRHYARKGYGESRLCEELRRRGIDRELWDTALAEAPEPDDTVYALLTRKLRGDDSPENIRRAVGYLQRRGFNWSDIEPALSRWKSREDEETEDTI